MGLLPGSRQHPCDRSRRRAIAEGTHEESPTRHRSPGAARLPRRCADVLGFSHHATEGSAMKRTLHLMLKLGNGDLKGFQITIDPEEADGDRIRDDSLNTIQKIFEDAGDRP